MRGNPACVWLADSAELVQDFPSYVVELLRNQRWILNLGSGPARGGGSSPPFRTNNLAQVRNAGNRPRVCGKEAVWVIMRRVWIDLQVLRNRSKRTHVAACKRPIFAPDHLLGKQVPGLRFIGSLPTRLIPGSSAFRPLHRPCCLEAMRYPDWHSVQTLAELPAICGEF